MTPPRVERAPALVLVATPIGNLGDLSPRAVNELRDADVIACEDTRRTRKLLSHAGVRGGSRLVAVHEHNEAEMAARLVERVVAGERVAYVTDAGMPAVSDPGERLVRACADAGVTVEVVPGPSAVLAALVVSGLPTERFVFEGFLPSRSAPRRERIDALISEPRSVVIFEAPHRVAATLEDLRAVLGDEREVAVVRELTKRHEETWRGSLGEASRALAGSPQGEHVVVLGPAPEGEVGDALVRSAVEAELTSGASVRDAAAAVSVALGVQKRRAYEVALALRSESTDAEGGAG